MPVIVSQNTQRREVTLKDQFGRRWHFTVEKATDDPTGAFNRVGGWRDPLKTPMNFITVPQHVNEEGQWRSIVIAFPAWLAQQDKAETKWYDVLYKTGRAEYKKVEPGEAAQFENDHYLRGIVGRKPWPSSDVLKAAQAGDRQYLGLEALDNAHREALGLPILEAQVRAAVAPAVVVRPTADVPPEPDTWPAYASWMARYHGIRDMSVVGGKWQERKQRLVVV